MCDDDGDARFVQRLPTHDSCLNEKENYCVGLAVHLVRVLIATLGLIERAGPLLLMCTAVSGISSVSGASKRSFACKAPWTPSDQHYFCLIPQQTC